MTDKLKANVAPLSDNSSAPLNPKPTKRQTESLRNLISERQQERSGKDKYQEGVLVVEGSERTWQLDSKDHTLSHEKMLYAVEQSSLRQIVEEPDGNVTLKKFSYCGSRFGYFPISLPQWVEASDFDQELGAGVIIMFKQYINFIAILLISTFISIPTLILFATYESDSDVQIELEGGNPYSDIKNAVSEYFY